MQNTASAQKDHQGFEAVTNLVAGRNEREHYIPDEVGVNNLALQANQIFKKNETRRVSGHTWDKVVGMVVTAVTVTPPGTPGTAFRLFRLVVTAIESGLSESDMG